MHLRLTQQVRWAMGCRGPGVPSEHEITDFKYPSSYLPFVVPMEGLLIASGADDGCLAGHFEQVNCVLLSHRGSVTVESFYSWCAMVEVRGQHGFCSVGQEDRCESCGSVWGHSQALEDRWDLRNPSPSVFVESIEDA